MASQLAPGLPANWLNGWLAAVGVTALLPEVRLSWSTDVTPLAVLDHRDEAPLAEQIASALPDKAALQQLALAALSRKATLHDFHKAARKARAKREPSAAASLTDLVSDRKLDKDGLPHGAFDPPAPHGATLVERAIACRQLLAPDPAKRIRDTLAGTALREPVNGLGFDIRRIPSGVQPSADVMADPVVECLCFSALELFPVRGDGQRQLQRGWTKGGSQRAAFAWPVWSGPLDMWGIDALLDRFYADLSGDGIRRLYGVTCAFVSVPYRGKGQSDVTRGYGSERTA